MKIGEDFTAERHVHLMGDVSDVFPFDRDVIVRPYFKAIFDEELNNWYRLESGRSHDHLPGSVKQKPTCYVTSSGRYYPTDAGDNSMKGCKSL